MAQKTKRNERRGFEMAKKGFIAEFKEFIARGNVMDLAVGVIIGGAFQSIVNSLVNDMIIYIFIQIIRNLHWYLFIFLYSLIEFLMDQKSLILRIIGY